MSDTATIEDVDLETMFDFPLLCEDDHRVDGDIPCPACAIEAVARLRWACGASPDCLVCQPMVEWIVAPPRAYCSACGRPDCLVITFI